MRKCLYKHQIGEWSIMSLVGISQNQITVAKLKPFITTCDEQPPSSTRIYAAKGSSITAFNKFKVL